MKKYEVDANSYYEKLREDKIPSELGYSFECYEDTTNQLINKFNLRNKKVLSLASLFGFEEYFFYINGCTLTLVDKNSSISRYFEGVKHSDNPTLTYIIAYIEDLTYHYLNDEWDILLMDGFPPDILFKNDLVFSELALKFIDNLKKGGLFICENYSVGPLMDDPVNIKAIKDQFESNGLQLLYVYHFRPYHTNISLIIGFKGSREEGLEFLETVQHNPEITNFNGRCKVEREINRSYKLVDHCEICNKKFEENEIRERIEEWHLKDGKTSVEKYLIICKECKEEFGIKVWVKGMRVLDLGCGTDKFKGDEGDIVIGIDIHRFKGVDIVYDLNKNPYPYESNSIDRIIMDDILEHLEKPIDVLRECHRILKKNGILKVKVVYWSHKYSSSDFTHLHSFSKLHSSV